jgi:hypothetical protein
MTSYTKINQILQNLPYGAVLYGTWLQKSGYSFSLQQSYRQSGWLRSIGKGVMVRSGQQLILSGAINALQQQAGLPVHIGGRTALGLLGFAHYLEVNRQDTLLFAPNGFNIPLWMLKNQWDSNPQFVKTSFLPAETGIISVDQQGFNIKISGAGRAMMECLEMAPAQFDLNEAWQIMQGLSLLRPDTVQDLLIQCKSVKVKRLFLYFAQKADHSWLKKIRMHEVDLGSGKRSLIKNGVYVPEYKITLPESLV